jgi:hypothetical protein
LKPIALASIAALSIPGAADTAETPETT